jgi:N-acetylneuraminic acid mutarotase
MKFLVLLTLLTSCSSFADFVYMKEDAQGKRVQLQTAQGIQTLNQIQDGVWALYPDVSANGQEFIYSEGAGPTDLHLTYMNQRKNITQRFNLPQKGMLVHPKFSKNGRFIFYSAPGKTGKNTIFFFDREAEVLRQGKNLTDFSLEKAHALDESEESYFPRPSSDGSFVIYQRNTAGKKEIILFDRVENSKTVLAQGMSPALSFDERLIAYTVKENGNYNIQVMDRVSKTVTTMTADSADEMAPTFRPDNSLVFASNKSGRFELYHLMGEKWHKLAGSSDADFYSPQFSGEKDIAQSERAPFIGEPRSSFGTVSHEGKIYMAGGHAGAEHTYPPESFQDTFLAYDIVNNEWTELAPRPVKAHGYQLAAFGNYVYAFGGFAYSENHKPKWKSLSRIDRYDIKENKWEKIGDLLEPRSSNVAVTIEGKVYLAGGWNSTPKFENDYNGKFHNTVEIFDLSSEKITLARYELPAPKRRALTGINLNGKIVLIGGLGEGATHFELLDQVTSINPHTGKSQELAPLPFGTFAPAAETLGNELFVFGGMFKTGPMAFEYVSHVYAQDLAEGKWRHTGRYLKETKGFSQVFKVNESTLGVLGGHRYFEGFDSPVTTFETFKK